MNKERLQILDFLRGIAVFLMVGFHIVYDLVYIEKLFAINMFGFWGKMLIIPGASLFIILSGFTFGLQIGGKNLIQKTVKGALKLGLLAFVITIVTFSLGKEFVIYRGIIHFFAFSGLVLYLLRGFYKSLPIFSIISIFLGQINMMFLPANNFLAPFGITNEYFYSADYYPIFPRIGVSIIGLRIYKYSQKNGIIEKLQKLNGRFPSFVLFAGKNSLLVYILHQPVIFALLKIFLK